MKRRLTALLCALSLLTGGALAAGTEYPDVPEWEWYAAAVREVTQEGLMAGNGEGAFQPMAPVTRAMVITVLWKMEGSPAQSDLTSFPDIDPKDEAMWYAAPAAWAKRTEVAWGYEDGTFHGEDLVTREQLAAFLYRYAKVKGQPIAEGSLGLFNDADKVSDWARDSLRHVVGMGYFRGSDEGDLDPTGTATRAELASILCRMLTPAVG